MAKISPLNLTAQLSYRARGNPPNSHIKSSVGNYYPGLEVDFRNLWRRIFVGIEVHEALGLVLKVDDAHEELKNIEGEIIISVDGHPVWTEVRGPKTVGGPTQGLRGWFLEWSNALADLVNKGGQKALCTFSFGENDTIDIEVEIRNILDNEIIDGVTVQRAVISRALAEPGELTQSLCSPWQNDFIGCGCYYWSASRPDYVNVEAVPAGDSRGHNWLQKDRNNATPLVYTLKRSDLLEHEDIISSWEDKLKFVFGGKDEG